MTARIVRKRTRSLNTPPCDGGQKHARQPDTGAAWRAKTRVPVDDTVRSALWLMVAVGLSVTAEAHAVGETTRVNVSSAGEQARGEARGMAPKATISADGRFVAFSSPASNLVPDDTNGRRDIFVHDRQTGQTTRVSVASSGEQGNDHSSFYGSDVIRPALSADGRFVAYQSDASNLVAGDTNRQGDFFVHDLQTHETTRVSVASDGTQANFSSLYPPALSANGRFVAFAARANNLVPGDTNFASNVYVHDRTLHQTTRVSVDSAGRESVNSDSPSLSADGRYVAFRSTDATLVPGARVCQETPQSCGADFIYVHDRLTHETTRITDYATSELAQAMEPSISADGRFVAFWSPYPFVPEDTNQTSDVFVHDRSTQQTTRVSVASDGSEGQFGSIGSSLSADGRFVAFYSNDPIFYVDADTDPYPDVFVHDRLNHQTTLISVDTAGKPSDDHSVWPSLSADGRFVAFSSRARKLVAGKTNGVFDIFVRDRLLDRSLRADLAVSQTAHPEPFLPLSPLSYTVTAVNNGPDAASEVTLYDRPPGNGTLISAVPSQGECSGGAPFVCRLGTLEPGATSTVTLTIKPKWHGATRLSNTARLNAAPVDPMKTNNKNTIRIEVAQ